MSDPDAENTDPDGGGAVQLRPRRAVIRQARGTLRLELSNTTANALAADDTVAGWGGRR